MAFSCPWRTSPTPTHGDCQPEATAVSLLQSKNNMVSFLSMNPGFTDAPEKLRDDPSLRFPNHRFHS